jgi:hypothetical protein
MGHDISPIGNHQLNIENIKVLAEDISNCLDINIVYGYWGQKHQFKLLGENREDENIILGNIVKDQSFKTFSLIDESYQLKELHEKLGDDLFYIPEYWEFSDGKLPKLEHIEQEKNDIIFPQYELTLAESDESDRLCIYKELYGNHIPYYSRWWDFCRFFTERKFENSEYLANILKFRKELKYYTQSFGGDTIYYLDDQSSVLQGVSEGDERYYNCKDFIEHVNTKTAHLMLNIPLFMTDINYRKEFLAKREYPLSFIDDFSDIE